MNETLRASARAALLATAATQYRQLGVEDISRKIVKSGCFIDVKSGFDAIALTAAGLHVWRL